MSQTSHPLPEAPEGTSRPVKTLVLMVLVQGLLIAPLIGIFPGAIAYQIQPNQSGWAFIFGALIGIVLGFMIGFLVSLAVITCSFLSPRYTLAAAKSRDRVVACATTLMTSIGLTIYMATVHLSVEGNLTDRGGELISLMIIPITCCLIWSFVPFPYLKSTQRKRFNTG